jgi:fermentation-respiration switch protein FrsA (DUF1100 family)
MSHIQLCPSAGPTLPIMAISWRSPAIAAFAAPASNSGVTREFFAYYRTPRGRHPRATTAMAVTGNPTLSQFRPFDHVETISPRPVLLVAGENAHSRYFSEEAFAKAAQPKSFTSLQVRGMSTFTIERMSSRSKS